jgi:hypothetical protein
MRKLKYLKLFETFDAGIEEDHNNRIKYMEPNFEFEWEEAKRYPEFEEIGKENWIRIAKKGYTKTYKEIKDVLSNVDLNFDSLEKPKKERFNQAFNNKKIEMSIAVKFKDGTYDLVSGNTRLSGLVNNGIDIFPIWIVDISS